MLNAVERVLVGGKVRCGGSVEKGEGRGGEWMTTGEIAEGEGWFVVWERRGKLRERGLVCGGRREERCV